MKKIWAPWRRKYICHLPVRGCIFCEKPRSRNDAKNYLLERGRTVFSILNLYPYNNGHLMIAPYRHIASPALLNSAETAELFEMMTRLMKKLDQVIKPHGYNIGMNVGRTAGAGCDKHIHMHVVPRWNGDTNFMPVLTGTKVISESLKALRQRLIAKR
jgi:ATP adenylyltransferase